MFRSNLFMGGYGLKGRAFVLHIKEYQFDSDYLQSVLLGYTRGCSLSGKVLDCNSFVRGSSPFIPIV